MGTDYLNEYYSSYNEEGRLLSRHGQVEYLTTMRVIRECLEGLSDPAILEVGAGTGRYSVTLAKEGLRVTAVELIEHNLDVLRSKLDGTEPISAMQGNALDLSALPDDGFDLTMLLGPMYHLYTKEDKLQALREAVRVTKPGGKLLVAYCMNEPTVIMYVFGLNHLHEVMELNMLTEDWHCISEPKDLFELVRTEDIAALDAELPVRRLKLVATDGATNFMREQIDAMDDETFAKWLDYHFAVCERQDLIGASHHTLDVLEKEAGDDA
ncbi:MAG: class I SAM-dependent methyltransferase [Oscillospiraceae bacterium]|nr:class I SAM-dependent methyltransferase [Oscillospiraceae bacterium]